MNKKIITIIASVFIIGIIFAVFFSTQKKQMEIAKEAKKEGAQITRDFNHAKGNLNSKIVVVEFYDPECESCKAFHPHFTEIIKAYEDRVKFVVRYMPLHGSSVMAVKLSEAAGMQGKFFEMYDLLFEKQDEWSHKPFPPLDLFMKYADNLGLNLEKLRSDMELAIVSERIGLDQSDAGLLGVRGTPTFFVNGKELTSLSPISLREMIESELKQN